MKFRKGEEVLMGLLPFYHIYGLMVLQFSPLTQGAKLIIHPRFDPEPFLKSIQEFKVGLVIMSVNLTNSTRKHFLMLFYSAHINFNKMLNEGFMFLFD